MSANPKPPLQPTPHPLAGRSMSGAEMVVQVIADEGTRAVFGYSGGAILPTYDAVFLFNQARASRGERAGRGFHGGRVLALDR
jgi:hypothetical protein